MTKKITIAGIQEFTKAAVLNAKTARAQKQASQFSPDSADNAEKPASTEPKVDPKLQNTGEGYEQAGISEIGMERHRDLVRNQPDEPIPDKGATPDTRNALDILVADGVQDALQSAGDPTMKVRDPQNDSSEPNVDDKLQLKKDAAAIVSQLDDLHKLGQTIIHELMAQTVGNKSASANAEPTFTAAQLLQESEKMAQSDISPSAVKEALLPIVEQAIYAADCVAFDLALKQANAQKPAPAPQKPPAAPKQTPAKQAAVPPEMVDPAAAEAMQQPMGGEMLPAEAEALLGSSLEANGVDPAMMGGAPPGGAPDGAPADGAADAGEIPPELLAEILPVIEMLEEQGYTLDEVVDALEEISGESAAGVDPAMGALADAEAEKTGHYKFASFIGRPRNKTAQQEQRAAKTRSALRDIIYGPGTTNFN